MLKVILMWVLFIPVPIINGIIREAWYKNKLGEIGANITGFFVLSSVFILYTYLFFKNQIASFSNGKLLVIGATWLFLTLIFEFGIGFAGHRSIEYMLADYNLLKGRLWPLVLTAIFLSPFIVKYIVKS